jgi:hypothetical protein
VIPQLVSGVWFKETLLSSELFDTHQYFLGVAYSPGEVSDIAIGFDNLGC